MPTQGTFATAKQRDDDDDGDNIINRLDIAEGLKNMLVSYGFELESLLAMQPYDLAKIHGIDEYVAKIIITAAHDLKRKVNAKAIEMKRNSIYYIKRV